MDLSQLLATGLQRLGLSELSAQQGEQLLWYLEELLRWNRRHNLTAISDPSEALEKHLLDALTLLPLLRGDERLLDLGSGAGLPGLVLKIASPNLELISIDAVTKKISFQRHVIRTLGLPRARAEARRIETLGSDAGLAGCCDVVVFRALGGLGEFLPLALPCLASGGRILAMKGPGAAEELREATADLDALGLLCRQQQLRLPFSGAERVLLTFVRG